MDRFKNDYFADFIAGGAANDCDSSDDNEDSQSWTSQDASGSWADYFPQSDVGVQRPQEYSSAVRENNSLRRRSAGGALPGRDDEIWFPERQLFQGMPHIGPNAAIEDYGVDPNCSVYTGDASSRYSDYERSQRSSYLESFVEDMPLHSTKHSIRLRRPRPVDNRRWFTAVEDPEAFPDPQVMPAPVPVAHEPDRTGFQDLAENETGFFFINDEQTQLIKQALRIPNCTYISTVVFQYGDSVVINPRKGKDMQRGMKFFLGNIELGAHLAEASECSAPSPKIDCAPVGPAPRKPPRACAMPRSPMAAGATRGLQLPKPNLPQMRSSERSPNKYRPLNESSSISMRQARRQKAPRLNPFGLPLPSPVEGRGGVRTRAVRKLFSSPPGECSAGQVSPAAQPPPVTTAPARRRRWVVPEASPRRQCAAPPQNNNNNCPIVVYQSP